MGEAEGALGALPKYIQISEMLIRRIGAGQLADGVRLPPEREMAQTLGISVGTLRRALADLASKGVLDRIQGSGNYVRHRPEVSSLYAFFRLEKVGGGGLPTARVLTVSRERKPADAPPFGPAAEAHRIRRLRLLDGEAIALEEIWLDASWRAEVAAADLSESLYLFYRRDLGLIVTKVEDQVGLGKVPDWAPEGFMSPERPCGFIERISWAQTGARAEFSRTWFDNDKARYISRMGKD